MSANLKCVGDRDVLRSLRVLIVDDNPGDRVLYKQMLADADPGTRYTFEEAETGAEALELSRRAAPDCILLDYLLPDMLGTEFLKILAQREADSPVPVVILTGFGDEATAVTALQSGAHGYIAKRELTGESLSTAVDAAVRNCASQKLIENSRREMAERNRELEQKYAQIERFYEKILRRLQNPARSLRDRIARLASELDRDLDPDRRREIKELQADSERLVIALGNLSDNPGLNLGQLLISTHPTSLTELVADTANTLRPAVESAGVRLSVRLQPGLPEMEVDRYRIEQVLTNLLDNAVRHTPARGQVHLNVDRLPGSREEISISVSDTGSGIRADRLETLFERHPHEAVAAGEDSPGIGLHVCREIVRSHGGRITVESLPEAGTRFTITLPVDARRTGIGNVWDHAATLPASPEWRIEERPRTAAGPQ